MNLPISKEMELSLRDSYLPQEVPERWRGLLDLLSELLDMPAALVKRAHPAEMEVIQTNNSASNPLRLGSRLPLSGTYCEVVVKSRCRLSVGDACAEPGWENAPKLEKGMRSYLGYPLFWSTGEVFGTICLMDSRPRRYDEFNHRVMAQFQEMVECHLMLAERTHQLELWRQGAHPIKDSVPICASCKKVRDQKGRWDKLESYVSRQTGLSWTQCLCPTCSSQVLARDGFAGVASINAAAKDMR